MKLRRFFIALAIVLAVIEVWETSNPKFVEAKLDQVKRVNLVRTPTHGLQPQAVVDERGTLHLIYLAGEPSASDVFYVRRDAGKKEFSPPLRVNSQPGSAIAPGTIRGAQIAIGKNGRVHVAWN